jgi:hypothetical protein
MRAEHAVLGVLALLTSLSPDRADAASRRLRGFELGARSGFGLPLGSASGVSDGDFNKLIANMVPIWLDAGFRATPNLFVGAYFMYGVGSPPSGAAMTCGTSGLSCSFHDTRIGVEFQYHAASETVDPWLGLGSGFEWYGFDESQGNQSAGLGASGWEFVNIQVGVDYKPAVEFGIGPFLMLTLAEFDHASLTSTNGGSQDQSISNQALHQWFVMGLRGIFDIRIPPPEPPKPVDPGE